MVVVVLVQCQDHERSLLESRLAFCESSCPAGAVRDLCLDSHVHHKWCCSGACGSTTDFQRVIDLLLWYALCCNALLLRSA